MGANIRRDLRKLLTKSRSQVDLETLMAEMLDAFDGPKALALHYKHLFDVCKSPMVQQKILMMIQSLVHACTVHNLSKPLPFESFTEDELDELMTAYLERFDDGTKEEGEPGADPAAAAAGPGADAAALGAGDGEAEGVAGAAGDGEAD